MIISPTREFDREVRMMFLETIKWAVENGKIEFAKTIGQSSEKLKHKMQTHDYTSQDVAHGLLHLKVKMKA